MKVKEVIRQANNTYFIKRIYWYNAIEPLDEATLWSSKTGLPPRNIMHSSVKAWHVGGDYNLYIGI